MTLPPENAPAWVRRAAAILDAFRRLLGRELVDRSGDAAEDARRGFVTGYSGIRISLTGRRFIIDDVTVFSLSDEAGRPAGHAAVIGSTRSVGQASRLPM